MLRTLGLSDSFFNFGNLGKSINPLRSSWQVDRRERQRGKGAFSLLVSLDRHWAVTSQTLESQLGSSSDRSPAMQT